MKGYSVQIGVAVQKENRMIKTIIKSIREYKRATLITPLLVSVEALLEILMPTLMALLIDRGIYAQDMGYVLRMGALLLAVSLTSLAAAFFAGRTAATASAGFARNLRHDMFSRVQEFSFSNIDRFSTASIITRLTTDVNNVQNAFQMMIRMAVRAPLMIIFALIFSFRINARLSLIFLAVIPFLALGLYFVISHVHPIFIRVFQRYDRLNNVVQENLHGIRVVKSFTREDHEIEKFGAISGDIYHDFVRAGKRLALNAPLMQASSYLSMLLLVLLGSQQIVAAGNVSGMGLTTGELTSLINYTMQILMSLMMLSMIFVMIVISRASAERIAELLNEESDLKDGANPVYEVKDGSIRFEHVTFYYDREADRPVLDDVSIDIASGQTVGVLGVTGSSKSSLVQLIPRLYDVSSGSVLVGGLDVRDYDLKALRDQVAMVLQKNLLFKGTIRDNLRWGNEQATDEEMIEACRLAQAHDFIMAFPDGYDTLIEQGGANVSGGQRQRLCIARALLKRPKILILDDSTSAVDTRTDKAIRKGLAESVPGTTKIIIAQRVASVQEADQILLMEEGRLLASGSHEELMAESPMYREVYDSQTQGAVLHG